MLGSKNNGVAGDGNISLDAITAGDSRDKGSDFAEGPHGELWGETNSGDELGGFDTGI